MNHNDLAFTVISTNSQY